MKKISALAASVLTLALLSAPTYAADISDAEIATLKAQIAKLSAQVDALQASQKATTATVKKQQAQAAVAPPAPTPAPTPVTAAPMAQPMMMPPQPAPNVVTAGSFPGSMHIPGTDTSIRFGGYIKLDAIADVGEGYGFPFAKFSSIPLSTDPRTQQGEQTTFGAQQSRVNFETHTTTSLGDLKTFVEGDFFGGGVTSTTAYASNANTNGYGFELRHAYGSLGPILAGQTWSNFEDNNAASESLDYIGSAGRVFVRQAQIRYTHDVGPVTASASLEAPIGNDSVFTSYNNVTSTTGTTNAEHGSMPDITARGDYHYANNGYVSLRSLLTQINVDHTVATTSNDTSSKMGYAFGISGKQGVLDTDSIKYDVNAGRGAGRYIYDIGATNNYASPTTGSLDVQQFFAATAGYQHYWSNAFRSNLFGGFVRNVNNIDYSGLTANKFIASGNGNLIWQPVPAYAVGVEYMRGYRKIESGTEGSLNRVETSFMYNF